MLPLDSIFRKYEVSFHCFADDIQIYLPLSSKGSFQSLQNCLNEVKAWLKSNFLNLNENKTEVIVFGKPDPTINFDFVHSTCIKNLGVTIDSSFKLDRQISSVVKASFFQLRLIAKVKSYIPSDQLEKLIHTLITTRLDYCNSLYYGLDASSIHRLQLVQNAAARLLTGKRRVDHITPVLKSLHWLPVSFRVHFKILLYVFKCLNGLAPEYLSEVLCLYAPVRALRSCDQLLLSCPRSRQKTRGDRAFAVAAPKLWNELPLSIRSAPTIVCFKSLLKTHLFALAFNTR